MHVEYGEFNVYNVDHVMEEVKLEGDYNISFIINEPLINSYKPNEYNYPERAIRNQSVYCKGNVLCRSNTENLKELINIFIRYTYDPCNDLNLDKSIASQEVLMSGTICPTRKVLFSYKSKVFIAYGRYIFGYDQQYVVMRRKGWKKCENSNYGDTSEEEEVDDSDEDSLCADEIELDDKISNDEIVVNTPKYSENDLGDDYVYSFMIYDEETKVLDAFGLYR